MGEKPDTGAAHGRPTYHHNGDCVAAPFSPPFTLWFHFFAFAPPLDSHCRRDPDTIIWLFNGRRVREMPNVYHQQALAVKVDSETMPNLFGLSAPNWRRQVYYVSYIRVWSRAAKAPRAFSARNPNQATVSGAGGEAAISPYALQRAPMPGSIEVAGLAEPVPRAGWGSFQAGRPSARSVNYIGPVAV